MAKPQLRWDVDGVGAASIAWSDIRSWFLAAAQTHLRWSEDVEVWVESVRIVDGDGREVEIPHDARVIAGFRRHD